MAEVESKKPFEFFGEQEEGERSFDEHIRENPNEYAEALRQQLDSHTRLVYDLQTKLCERLSTWNTVDELRDELISTSNELMMVIGQKRHELETRVQGYRDKSVAYDEKDFIEFVGNIRQEIVEKYASGLEPALEAIYDQLNAKVEVNDMIKKGFTPYLKGMLACGAAIQDVIEAFLRANETTPNDPVYQGLVEALSTKDHGGNIANAVEAIIIDLVEKVNDDDDPEEQERKGKWNARISDEFKKWMGREVGEKPQEDHADDSPDVDVHNGDEPLSPKDRVNALRDELMANSIIDRVADKTFGELGRTAERATAKVGRAGEYLGLLWKQARFDKMKEKSMELKGRYDECSAHVQQLETDLSRAQSKVMPDAKAEKARGKDIARLNKELRKWKEKQAEARSAWEHFTHEAEGYQTDVATISGDVAAELNSRLKGEEGLEQRLSDLETLQHEVESELNSWKAQLEGKTDEQGNVTSQGWEQKIQALKADVKGLKGDKEIRIYERLQAKSEFEAQIRELEGIRDRARKEIRGRQKVLNVYNREVSKVQRQTDHWRDKRDAYENFGKGNVIDWSVAERTGVEGSKDTARSDGSEDKAPKVDTNVKGTRFSPRGSGPTGSRAEQREQRPVLVKLEKYLGKWDDLVYTKAGHLDKEAFLKDTAADHIRDKNEVSLQDLEAALRTHLGRTKTKGEIDAALQSMAQIAPILR